MKKTWESPKLIVLVRGEPEERVLDGCKGTNPTAPSSPTLLCTAAAWVL